MRLCFTLLAAAGAALGLARVVSAQAAPTRGPGPDPYAAPPLPACDPMDWQEPEGPPPLRSRLPDEMFRKAYAQAMALASAPAAGQAASGKAAGSPEGLRVTTVEPGSQADQLGVKVGDTLLKLDDQALSRPDDLISLRSRQDQKLTVQTAKGETKTLTLKRGKIGLDTGAHWDAYAAYLRSPGRAPKYDDDMRVAALTYNGTRALAATALWHAYQDGYRGYPLTAMAALNAYSDNRFDDALVFATLAMKEAAGPDRARLGPTAWCAAMGSFKFERARELQKEFPEPEAVTQRLDAAIRTYRSYPKEILPNPIEQLKTLRFGDATADITAVSLGSPDRDWMDAAARDLAARRPVHLEAPTGAARLLPFVPATADVDLTMRFTYGPTDPTKDDLGKYVAVSLMEEGPTGRPLVKINFFPNGTVTLLQDGPPDFVEKVRPEVGFGHAGYLHVAAIGHRLEVVADGRRLLYNPITVDPAGRRVCGVIQVMGVKCDFQDLTWRVPEPGADK